MRIYLFLITALLSVPAMAQQKKILVNIIDITDKKPIPDAVITITNLTDSTLIDKGISDQNGQYKTQTQANAILLKVSARSYQQLTVHLTIKANDSLVAELHPLVREMKGATVSAKTLPFIVQDIKQTVINPEALVTSAGLSAVELLERAPGVLIDQQGGIRLQGISGVSLYVNDQLIVLGEEELMQYLRSIPADNIQHITLMTNPSSKYPAAGSGGVIVIRLKKTKTRGFNGRYGNNLGTGRYMRHNQSGSFNYRINGVNIFGNGSGGIQNNYQDLTIKRAYYGNNGELASSFVQNTYIRKKNIQYQANLGADLYLNDKQTLTVSLNGMNLNAERNTANYAEIRDGGYYLKNQVRADIPINTLFQNTGANIYYDISLDSGRGGISFYSEYSRYYSKNKQSTLNRLFDSTGVPASQTLLIGDLPSDIRLLTNGLDYRKDWRKKGNMELGFRSSWIRAGNYAGFYDDVNGVRTINNTFTNDFDYQENIKALYWNHSTRVKRLTVQAGLRYEYTESKGHQKGNSVTHDSSFIRRYHSLFPTCYISYALDSLSNHVIGVNFGRRINRPNYQDMNPFIYPLDRYTLYAGNPFIKPTFSNEVELTYLYKSNWRANAVAGVTNNLISETIEQVSGIFYSRPGNIGQQINLGFNLSGSAKFTKWARMNIYAELSHNRFSGTLYNLNLTNNGTYFYAGPNFNFTLHTKWSAELSGTYQSKVASAQFLLIPVGTARAGIAWQFNKSGSLRLAVTDFMYTMKPGGDILSLNQSAASWRSFMDTRVVMMSFSYQFNKGKSLNRLKDEQPGAEKQRVRVG